MYGATNLSDPESVRYIFMDFAILKSLIILSSQLLIKKLALKHEKNHAPGSPIPIP
jgi:hypothetical protein